MTPHTHRQQTLALTKERGNVSHDESRNNGVDIARAKIALVLAKQVSLQLLKKEMKK